MLLLYVQKFQGTSQANNKYSLTSLRSLLPTHNDQFDGTWTHLGIGSLRRWWSVVVPHRTCILALPALLPTGAWAVSECTAYSDVQLVAATIHNNSSLPLAMMGSHSITSLAVKLDVCVWMTDGLVMQSESKPVPCWNWNWTAIPVSVLRFTGHTVPVPLTDGLVIF